LKVSILILLISCTKPCFAQYGALFEPIYERLKEDDFSFLIKLDNDTILRYSENIYSVSSLNNFNYDEGYEGDTISGYVNSIYSNDGRLKKYISQNYKAVYHYESFSQLKTVDIKFSREFAKRYNLKYRKITGFYRIENCRITKIETKNPYLEMKVEMFIISYY
jgi:hypothetical protein